MSTKLIIACIRPERLPAVEAALRAANVNDLSAAHSGLPGDGVVAVVPVEGLYDIRQGRRG